MRFRFKKNDLYIFCIAALVATLGAGCASEVKLSSQKKALQKKVEEYQAEVEIGRNMAGRLLTYYGTYGDRSTVEYLNKVGNYIGTYSDAPERRYMFAILDTEAVNAFACPGGYILITLGALKKIKTEAELAAILGHEVAHVGRRHMFDTLRSMDEKERTDQAKELDSRKKNEKGKPYSMRVRKRPDAEKSATGDKLARYLSGSSGTGLSLLQAASAGMSVILEKGLDQKLEYEADQLGVKYAIRAGYEPKGMLHFLQRLEQGKKHTKLKTLEKTHPTVINRQRKIVKLLRSMKAHQMVGAIGKERYQQFYKVLPQSRKNTKI
ncbi:MAG: M48 family metalloprotease [Oligoflexales bacterium]